ncbi:helix-turn-helix transcriptional regulator [Staphylococcus pseudintermedius]|nr:helix-turn-helix transcriptional regulator [Staphylococcus pseudintermedius]
MELDFNKRLKEIRKKRGFTQLELAKRIGVSKQVISNLERGYTRPNSVQIQSLANVLNTTTYELMDGDFSARVIPFMFEDKAAFDALPEEDKKEIIKFLKEQADFFIKLAQQKNK